MSDSLREALEKLARRWARTDCRVDLPENAQWGEGVAQGYSNAAADLLRTLDIYTAEPVGVSDEAVEALTDALAKHVEIFGIPWHLKKRILTDVRLFMGATPVASRDRVAEVQKAHRYIECNDNSEPACLCGVEFPGGFDYIEHSEHVAAALLAAGVFREPPTREQIDGVLQDHGFGDIRYASAESAAKARGEAARAVLALLGGEEEGK